MHIKDEVKREKAKIDKIKFKIVDIDNSLKELKQQLKEVEKLKNKYEEYEDEDIEKIESEIEKIESEIESLNESKVKLKWELEKLEDELTYHAIMNGYDVTTEDIAIMLDSTTDFVTRKLKDSIEHINVKAFDAYENISDFKKFNILEIQKLHKKSIFFYREDVKNFIKEHTFNIEEHVNIEIDLKDTDINKEDALKIINEHLKSKMKRYEFNTSIDDDTVDKIFNNEIQLSKASTIKKFVYKLYVDKNCSKMYKQIKRMYIANSSTIDEDVAREQEDLVEDYMKREMESLYDKNISVIHDAQVKRHIEMLGYPKYYFIYSNKAIALYDENAKRETEPCQLVRSQVTNEGVILRVLKSLTHTDFEKEILKLLN